MRRRYKLLIITGIIVLILTILGGVYALKITAVVYLGNTWHTEEELTQMIFDKPYSLNPIYCLWESKYGEKKQIPFVQTYDITFKAWNNIQIQIYEKSLIGYVDYKGYYMYFDKDGIVVDSSQEVLESVIKIEGLQFSHMVLYEKLPVEKEEVFNLILNLTQMLIKAELPVEKVYLDKDYNVTVHIENIRFKIGQDEYLNEKVNKIKDLYPSAKGLSGEFDMREFAEDTKDFRFKKDKE